MTLPSRLTPIFRFIPLLLIMTIGAFLRVSPVLAAEYQSCTQGSTCTVGEFLFDDNYQPIATASCTLTSRDPAGTPYLTGTPLTGTNDGWYAQSIDTSNLSLGLYRSQICCTSDTDYLCIDKSFTVKENPGGQNLSSQDIENAVWNATASNHLGSGSVGERLQQTATISAQDVANSVWGANTGSYTTPGTFGNAFQNLSTLTANDVWNFTTRNLTGFGSLVTDIWNNPTRTLSGFGDLVTNIWTYNTRALTDFGDLVTNIWGHSNRTLTANLNVDTSGLASKTDMETLKKQIADFQAQGLDYSDRALLQKVAAQVVENRDLLDALVNQPIIQSSLEDNPTPDLQSKIDKTKQTAENLYASSQELQSRTGLLTTKWDQLPKTEIQSELDGLINILGDSNSTSATPTVASQIAWVQSAWGGTLADNLATAQKTARTEILAGIDQLPVNQAGSLAHLQKALVALNDLDTTIGNVTSQATDSTLYGKIKAVQALASTLDHNDAAINTLLAAWKSDSPDTITQTLAAINQSVLQINQLSNAQAIITAPTGKPENQAKNQLLGLQAVNSINRLLLASMQDKPVKDLWLLEGSVIFKTLVTNPSQRISQKIPLKYYLPKEIKKEDIIKADPQLTINYDPDQGALYASGEIDLASGETRTFSIEVNDIWVVSPDEINSLKKQAADLMQPLQKTAFFGQGTTIKSNIDVVLEKILAALPDNRTPEARIRFFRESQIELAGVDDQLSKLKDLVAQAGNSSPVINFIGGIQSLVVWVLIIVLLGGFAFMIAYLRFLRPQLVVHPADVRSYSLPLRSPLKPNPAYQPARLPSSPKRLKAFNLPATRTFMILVVVLSSAIFTLTLLNIRSHHFLTQKPPATPSSFAAAIPSTSVTSPSSAVLGTDIVAPTPKLIGGGQAVTLVIPPNHPISLLDSPDPKAPSLLDLKSTLNASLLQVKNDYGQIEFTMDTTTLIGWVPAALLVPLTP